MLALLTVSSTSSGPQTQPHPAITTNLQSILATTTDVLTELTDGAAEENRGDYMYSSAGAGLEDYPETDTPEDLRKRKLTNNNVAYTVNARDFAKGQIEGLIAISGESQAFQSNYLKDVDPEVLKGFAGLNLL